MENLLEHHILETRERFSELRDDIKNIEEKIDGLHDFKIETIVSARWVSLIVSAVCGLLTMIASGVVKYFIDKN